MENFLRKFNKIPQNKSTELFNCDSPCSCKCCCLLFVYRCEIWNNLFPIFSLSLSLFLCFFFISVSVLACPAPHFLHPFLFVSFLVCCIGFILCSSLYLVWMFVYYTQPLLNLRHSPHNSLTFSIFHVVNVAKMTNSKDKR